MGDDRSPTFLRLSAIGHRPSRFQSLCRIDEPSIGPGPAKSLAFPPPVRPCPVFRPLLRSAPPGRSDLIRPPAKGTPGTGSFRSMTTNRRHWLRRGLLFGLTGLAAEQT